MSDAGRTRPLCARPARFLRENFPGVTLRLEGRRVVFHDPQQRPGLAAYVREVEPWILKIWHGKRTPRGAAGGRQ